MDGEVKTIKENRQHNNGGNRENFKQRNDNFRKSQVNYAEESIEDTKSSKIVLEKKPVTNPFLKNETLIFGKWSTIDVRVTDISLAQYISLDMKSVPHTFGKGTRQRFAKANVSVVERLINKVMRSSQGKRKLSGKFIRGRNGCGKKILAMEIVEGAFDIIQEKTGSNPIQVLVDAIQFSAPREDTTRVKKGGVAYSISVDVAPGKRIDEALKNLALAGFVNSFNSKRSAAECLAEELMAASKQDTKSIAVKRRDEVERIAKSSR